MSTRVISSKQQKLSAQLFAICTNIAVLLPILVPIWIAASIFVYASIAHHPNTRVRDYLVPQGYRFYGVIGALVVILNFSSQLANMVGGGKNLILICWALAFLVIVPLNIRDILRANKEPWREITTEVEA